MAGRRHRARCHLRKARAGQGRIRHSGRLQAGARRYPGRSRHVAVRRPSECAHERAIVHDVVRGVVREHVTTRTEHPVVRRAPPDRHSDAAPPHERGRSRCPADVRVVGGRDAPNDPRRRILVAWNPRPAVAARPNPAPVVEHDFTERVVADPNPIVPGVERPVTGCHVRREASADDVAIGHPDDPVLRILDPGAVWIELRAEVGESARIVVGDLRGIDGPSFTGGRRRCAGLSFRRGRLLRGRTGRSRRSRWGRSRRTGLGRRIGRGSFGRFARRADSDGVLRRFARFHAVCGPRLFRRCASGRGDARCDCDRARRKRKPNGRSHTDHE
jgi:hypothetical protein